MLRVVVWRVSVTAVTAAVLLTTRFSKLPPEVPVMFADTSPASMYTSSPGAATITEPDVLPAAMLMVWPLLRVTVIAVPAGLLNVAV
ncbi:hypothetical protein D3C78_1102120 [compost metagenome]